MQKGSIHPRTQALLTLLLILALPLKVVADDLASIRNAGVLRHLGIPYAHFITGGGDGLDVELIKGFAREIGVSYQFIQTDWRHIFGDLTGRNAVKGEDGARFLDEAPRRGDLIANGLTILKWRQEVVDFSNPTFPSAVWLVAKANSPLQPINPSNDLAVDIAQVKSALGSRSVMAMENTCLDPRLYGLGKTQAKVVLASNLKLNELAPAVLGNHAESTLLDVPDALIALDKWPGQLKVIGPVSESQAMAVAFAKDTPQLRAAFNRYLAKIKKSGEYKRLVEKYYPSVFLYFEDFFKR